MIATRHYDMLKQLEAKLATTLDRITELEGENRHLLEVNSRLYRRLRATYKRLHEPLPDDIEQEQA